MLWLEHLVLFIVSLIDNFSEKRYPKRKKKKTKTQILLADNGQVFQLHCSKKLLLSLQLRSLRSQILDRRSGRGHGHALLGPQDAQTKQAKSLSHPRHRRQRNVAMGRLHFSFNLQVQRLRSRPAVLRRLLHLPAGPVRVFPGAVRDGPSRRPRRRQDARRRDELRGVRGLQHGGTV